MRFWSEQSLELHELSALKAFANGPLEYAAIDGYGDQCFGLAFSHGVLLHHPADLPHWSGVLLQSILAVQHRLMSFATDIIQYYSSTEKTSLYMKERGRLCVQYFDLKGSPGRKNVPLEGLDASVKSSEK